MPVIVDLGRFQRVVPDQLSNARFDAVEASEDLYGTLAEISLAVWREQEKRKLDKRVETMKMLIKLLPAEKQSSPKELKAKIDKLYRDAGLTPPD